MEVKNLPQGLGGVLALNDLVFTDINDSPDNTRFGLGYHQLYDPNKLVGLIAKLPEVTRVGDTITLHWDSAIAQQYDLDQATIDKGWLSFSVSPTQIRDPQGTVYYSLYDHEADDLQTSPQRTIAVNRRVPGGLDPNTDTAINEKMAPCTVSPDPVSNPSAAVSVMVPVWDNQELRDELTVMWNNIRVTLAPLQTLGPQTVLIPREVLEAGGSSDKLLVNYELRDIVDNYSLVSPATYVRVEIDPDALTAPRVDEANRTTLVLDLEALSDNDAHVTIPPYSGNGNPYTVTLTWVGKTQTADISLNLPPQTVEDPFFDHATFTIPNAHMKLIAGGSAVVRYRLLQQGNATEKQSKTTSITITGLPVELAAPVVVEAGGTAIIDLALIIGASVTVTVAAYAGQSMDDKILLSWRGTPVSGSPVNYTDEYTIKAGEELRPTTFTVLRENLDPLGDGTLALSYQVLFAATGNTQNSALNTYSIIAAVSESLPAPTVAGVAQGGTLNPAPITDGVQVTVHYDTMLATDKIRVAWFGAPSIVEVNGDATKTVQVTIPNSAVAVSLGQSVVVRYGVTHQGGTESASDMVQFSVGQLAQTALPTPAVTEAQNGVLDLNTFAGNAHVTVAKWPLIAQGQNVWLTVSGPGGVPTVKLLDGYPITAQEVSNGIARDIPRTHLEAYTNGAEMRVVFKVAFDASNSEGLAVQFPDLRLTVDVSPADLVEDFNEHSADLITVGASIKTQYMTIRFLTGTGQTGFRTGYQIPPEAADWFKNPILQVCYANQGDQKIELELDTACKEVKFDVHGVAANTTAVRYLDASKNQLFSHVLPTLANQQISYASTGNPIRYIEINGNKDWTLWDNFVMKI
jgi:hypothetical protein